jgi:hypothetical protein
MKTGTTKNEIKEKLKEKIDTYFMAIDLCDNLSSMELKTEISKLLKEYEKKSK